MEDAVPVHVLNSLHKLVDVTFDSCLREVALSAFDCFVQIHFHNLKNKRKSAGRFIVENLDQLNDVIVGR